MVPACRAVAESRAVGTYTGAAVALDTVVTALAQEQAWTQKEWQKQ